jgi:hypothetical protein
MKRVSLIATLGVVSSLTLVPVVGASAATAGAHAAGPAVYTSTATHVTRLAHSADGLKGLHAIKSGLAKNGPGRVIPFLSPGGSFPAKRGIGLHAVNTNSSLPTVTGSTSGNTGASVVHHFNAISDLDSDNLNGFPLTPPDQGLCVGRPSGSKTTVVFELVNLAARVTDVHGTQLQPDISLATLFQDPQAFSDPRCLYDAKTQSFYFTVISFPPGGPNPTLTNTVVDVGVLNSNGFSVYQIDTSSDGTSSGQCLGDQPKTGFDNNALVISTDQFCGPTLSNFEGALVLAISKAQLDAQASTVDVNQFGPVSLAGIPITGLDPAIGTGTGTGYLVNSFPFDATGANIPTSTSLGLWTLSHSGSELTGKVIKSEKYAFPVPAASTGDGSVNGDVTSEAFLNPDDSRLSGPVEVTRTSHGGVELWTALDTALNVKGDSSVRDGGAWFKIDTVQQRVGDQGYIAAKGANLLYPAVAPRPGGPPAAAMVFTITSPSINPAAAFTTLASKRIKTVAAGAGPHLSFAEVVANQFRWGDYSFVGTDSSGNLWLATEYIPPAQFQDPEDNWGTFVFAVH